MTDSWEFILLADLGVSLFTGLCAYGLLRWRQARRDRRMLSLRELETEGQYYLRGYNARPNTYIRRA